MRSVLLAILLLLAAPATAFAYCERYPTPAEEFAEAEYVYLAQVVSAKLDRGYEAGFFDGIEYVVEPITIFKGEPPAALTLNSENSSARFPMAVSGWYLIFVGPASRIGFQNPSRIERALNSCGNSFAVSEVPMAPQGPPETLTFEQLMGLAPHD